MLVLYRGIGSMVAWIIQNFTRIVGRYRRITVVTECLEFKFAIQGSKNSSYTK